MSITAILQNSLIILLLKILQLSSELRQLESIYIMLLKQHDCNLSDVVKGVERAWITLATLLTPSPLLVKTRPLRTLGRLRYW